MATQRRLPLEVATLKEILGQNIGKNEKIVGVEFLKGVVHSVYILDVPDTVTILIEKIDAKEGS